MSSTKKSFFGNKEQPVSTTNAGGKKFDDMITPKGDIIQTPDNRRSMAVAQTPKTGTGLPLDLTRLENVPEADDQDEDTARGEKRDNLRNTEAIPSGRTRLTSPQADLARKSLAEVKAQQNKEVNGGEETVELPQSEFQDFLSTYEDTNRYWTAKDAEGNEVEPGSEMDFPSLNELMMEESKFQYSETTTLKQKFSDIAR